jgi:hypothetical protein
MILNVMLIFYEATVLLSDGLTTKVPARGQILGPYIAYMQRKSTDALSQHWPEGNISLSHGFR